MDRYALMIPGIMLCACQTVTPDGPELRNSSLTNLESRVTSLESSQRENSGRLGSAERRILETERKVEGIDRTITGYANRIDRLEKHAKKLDLSQMKSGCRVIFRGDPNSPEPPSLEHLCPKVKS